MSALIKEAQKNNLDILAAKSRYEAAKARIPQAKSLENPSIGFTSGKIPRGTLKLNKTMAEDRMLSINQAIPWFGKLSLKGKIALVESQMIAGEYRDKELQIINEVKQDYYALFMNYKKTELNQASLIFLKEIIEIAEAKYVVGDIPQADLFKINLELSKLNNDIDNLRQERGALETRLNVLLNRKPDALLDAPELKEGLLFSKDLEVLYRLAFENQPELLIFSYAIEKNKYAKSLAKKSFLPDIMTGVVLRGITTGAIGPWDLMLAFSVPLWFWTKQRYEVKEAIANLEEAQGAYSAMKNRAIAEVKELTVKVRIAQDKINLYKNTQIPLVEGSISTSRSAYLSNKGDIMMLLDSERMLVETKMNYYSALVEYHMNFADLERTVGVNLSEVKG
ncbi:MAG: TolC family protein [Candidatus Omnitrophica bacterium]|nr:TolC family protein [Candidatus Omnitrophota bacterium]